MFPEDFVDKIIHGKCLDIMKDIPDNSIDMILCDLPYGVTRQKWDKVIPLEPLWAEYNRIAKETAAIVLTATQPFASDLIQSNRKNFRYDWIWEKNKSTGFLNANKMPLRRHEHILVFYRKLPDYHPQKTYGHKPTNACVRKGSATYGKVVGQVCAGGRTDRHPTSILTYPVVNNDDIEKSISAQKPVPLFEHLVRSYTAPGDLVLDNCIGSGTTAEACINSGRHFIGIDADSSACDISRIRIQSLQV